MHRKVVLALVSFGIAAACGKKGQDSPPVAATDAAGSAGSAVAVADAGAAAPTTPPPVAGAQPAGDGMVHVRVVGADGLEPEASMPSPHKAWYGTIKAKLAACDAKPPLSVTSAAVTVEYKDAAATSVGIPGSVPDAMVGCIDKAFRLAPPPAGMTAPKVTFHLTFGEGVAAPAPAGGGGAGGGARQVKLVSFTVTGPGREPAPVQAWFQETLFPAWTKCLAENPSGTRWRIDADVAVDGTLKSVSLKSAGGGAGAPASNAVTTCVMEATMGATMGTPAKPDPTMKPGAGTGSAPPQKPVKVVMELDVIAQ